MNTVAIDIGSYSIKALYVKRSKADVEILRVIEVPNPIGMSIPTDDLTKEKLAQQIQAMFADNALPTDDVRLALPESVVSTKVIQVPVLTDAELSSAIGWQAEQYIPIPKDELELEYQVLFRPDKSDRDAPMRVLLVGAQKKIVQQIVSIFTDLGIEPTIIETQTIAIWRAIHTAETDPTSLVAHIGLSTLDLSIERKGELAFVFSHPQGGMLLTRAVENTLALPVQQAEEYKRTYGLDPSVFEGKVQAALLPLVQSMCDQILKANQYFSSQFPQEAVQRIYLSGGTALLTGLVSHVTSVTGVEVLLVSPFAKSKQPVTVGNPTAFSVCMGLALRDE